MISVVFALLTAASNATASVLQRRAASQAPQPSAMHIALIAQLARRKVWLAGIGMVIVAALCQAAALGTGPIALVQPIFIIELPIALLLASSMARSRLPSVTWGAVAMVTVGLGTGLAMANPSGGTDQAGNAIWIIALAVTGCFEFVLISAAVGTRGEARAMLLGLAAACAYAMTAALMKNAMALLGRGATAFLTAWQLYATAAVGVAALFLLQNALQAGTLVASQPMLTVGDALISISYGVTLFGEDVRTGWWLLPELIALALIVAGCVEIAKSPLAAGQPSRQDALDGRAVPASGMG